MLEKRPQRGRPEDAAPQHKALEPWELRDHTVVGIGLRQAPPRRRHVEAPQQRRSVSEVGEEVPVEGAAEGLAAASAAVHRPRRCAP